MKDKTQKCNLNRFTNVPWKGCVGNWYVNNYMYMFELIGEYPETTHNNVAYLNKDDPINNIPGNMTHEQFRKWAVEKYKESEEKNAAKEQEKANKNNKENLNRSKKSTKKTLKRDSNTQRLTIQSSDEESGSEFSETMPTNSREHRQFLDDRNNPNSSQDSRDFVRSYTVSRTSLSQNNVRNQNINVSRSSRSKSAMTLSSEQIQYSSNVREYFNNRDSLMDPNDQSYYD